MLFLDGNTKRTAGQDAEWSLQYHISALLYHRRGDPVYSQDSSASPGPPAVPSVPPSLFLPAPRVAVTRRSCLVLITDRESNNNENPHIVQRREPHEQFMNYSSLSSIQIATNHITAFI